MAEERKFKSQFNVSQSLEENVELSEVAFVELTAEIHDGEGGSIVNFAHAGSIYVTLHSELTSEFAEFHSLELGANSDTAGLAHSVDEGFVVSFIAVISEEDDLSALGFNSLDGLSVTRNQVTVDSDLIEESFDFSAICQLSDCSAF
ncbi:Hypothetical_protein [Hexamita inflata]|uniref:Hypothetical_protein n=1 Tax=Hexamita inflata TaxID=28002 RepID=A0AA86NXT6_9EUKA|nr:Hypothetical protein HINF_LOCUS14767 [Hexamita inflata]